MPWVARPAAKVTACCSAMPTSKKRSGIDLLELIERRAGRHRRGDADDRVIGCCQLDQRFGEDILVLGWDRGGAIGARLGWRRNGMAALVVLGRGREALAFFGDDMQEDGPVDAFRLPQWRGPAREYRGQVPDRDR